MRRRLVNALTLLSLLLFVAVCVLWVRSYRHPRFVFYDWFVAGPPLEVRSVHWKSDNGSTYVTFDRTIARTDDVGRWLAEDEPRGFQTVGFVRGQPLRGLTDGFHYRWLDDEDAQPGLAVVVRSVGAPYWALAAASAALPLAWASQWSARRRRHQGVCLACGYDLRATPDRCPECGTAAAAKPAASSG